MFENKSLYNFIVVFLSVLLIVIITTLLLFLNRGFDFTDEGGFLLSYANTNIYRGGVYNYHIIIDKLTNWLNPGIIEYRWMSLFTLVISSVVLSYGLYKWLITHYLRKADRRIFLLILLFMSIGGFLFRFSGMAIINNNTLTNFFLQISTGIILYLFSLKPEGLTWGRNLFLLSIIGVLTTYGFFVKFSSGIIQFIVYLLVFIVYLIKQPDKRKLYVIGSFLLGVVIGFGSYFLFFQGYGEWLFNFKKEYFILSDHSPELIFKRYFTNIKSYMEFSLRYFSWLIIFPILVYYQYRIRSFFKFDMYKYLKITVLIFSLALFVYELYYFKFYRTTFASSGWKNAYFYMNLILLQLSLLFAYNLRENNISRQFLKRNSHIVLLLALLLITPFIGAFGTRNIIFVNVLIHSAPWFAIIIILSFYLSRKIKSQVLISLFITITSLVTATQIVDGNTLLPYHSIFFTQNKSNQFQQTETVESISRLKGVYIDIETKIFLTELHDVLADNNFRSGYPIFGFNMPGIVYLMEGISPGMPYYFNRKRDLKAFDTFELHNNPPVILLTDENPIIHDLLSRMKDKGVNFPEAYTLKGEIYFPNTNSMLKVYFPKSFF